MNKKFLLLAILSGALLLSGCDSKNAIVADNSLSNDQITINSSSTLPGSATSTPHRPQDGPIIGQVGDKIGYFLIKKINQDSVEGSQAVVYPVARPDDVGTPRTLRLGDDIGLACEGISEKLTGLDFSAQTATFTKVTGPAPRGGCPI